MPLAATEVTLRDGTGGGACWQGVLKLTLACWRLVLYQRSLREVLGGREDAFEKLLDALSFIMLIAHRPLGILRTYKRGEEGYRMLIDAYVVNDGNGFPFSVEVFEFEPVNCDDARGLRSSEGLPAFLEVITLKRVLDVLRGDVAQ